MKFSFSTAFQIPRIISGMLINIVKKYYHIERMWWVYQVLKFQQSDKTGVYVKQIQVSVVQLCVYIIIPNPFIEVLHD